MLIVEEDLETCGENSAKCYTYFMVQVQVQDEENWIPLNAPNLTT